MTDWWNTSTPQTTEDVKPVTAPGWDPEPEPVAPPPPPEPPTQEEPEPQSSNRKKTLLLGAAGAAAAGIIVFAVMPHGGSGVPTGTQSASSQAASDSLPAAGGGPARMPEQDKAKPAEKAQAPKTVTLTAEPSGKGQVGAVVEVVIHNGTDDTLTVMPSLVKGDGRPAVIGEGTLAPGLLKIGPGETGKGTVEFATPKAPGQVALVDLSGNVVAAS